MQSYASANKRSDNTSRDISFAIKIEVKPVEVKILYFLARILDFKAEPKKGEKSVIRAPGDDKGVKLISILPSKFLIATLQESISPHAGRGIQDNYAYR